MTRKRYSAAGTIGSGPTSATRVPPGVRPPRGPRVRSQIRPADSATNAVGPAAACAACKRGEGLHPPEEGTGGQPGHALLAEGLDDQRFLRPHRRWEEQPNTRRRGQEREHRSLHSAQSPFLANGRVPGRPIVLAAHAQFSFRAPARAHRARWGAEAHAASLRRRWGSHHSRPRSHARSRHTRSRLACARRYPEAGDIPRRASRRRPRAARRAWRRRLCVVHGSLNVPSSGPPGRLSNPCNDRNAGVAVNTTVARPVEGAPFGARLRRHRLAAGLTQEQLAARAGLSARGVQDLERGARTTPQRETVRRLAAALGLSPGEAAVLGATVSRSRRARAAAGGRTGDRRARPPAAGPGAGATAASRWTASSAASGSWPPCGSACSTRRAPADPHRPGRGGQDPPGPARGGRVPGRLPGRRLVRAPGPAGDPALVAAAVAGVLGVRESAATEAQPRPWRRSCATGASSWCWTTASTCSRRRRLVADLLARLPGPAGAGHQPGGAARLRRAGVPGAPALAARARSTSRPRTELLQFEAPALFVQRAVAAQADFAVTPRERPRRGRSCAAGWTGCPWPSSWPPPG